MSTQKRCIFCGRNKLNGNVSLTKEHILPKWLYKTSLHDNDTKNTQNRTVIERIDGELIASSENETRPGDSTTRKVRVICQSCNSGWLSRLENKAKPILLPMLEGKKIKLSLEDQELLAAWVMKVTITNEYFANNDITISAKDRKYFFKYKKLPINWRVMIGSYQGQIWRKKTFRYCVGLQYETQYTDGKKHKILCAPPIEPNTQSTTFGLGHVIFHSFSTRTPMYETHATGDENIHGQYNIWPRREAPLCWPTTPHLSEYLANEFAKSLYIALRRSNVDLPPLPLVV